VDVGENHVGPRFLQGALHGPQDLGIKRIVRGEQFLDFFVHQQSDAVHLAAQGLEVPVHGLLRFVSMKLGRLLDADDRVVGNGRMIPQGTRNSRRGELELTRQLTDRDRILILLHCRGTYGFFAILHSSLNFFSGRDARGGFFIEMRFFVRASKYALQCKLAFSSIKA
jgi:hypothetical protein